VNTQLNLETAYKNFFRDKSVGFPKFKGKRNDRKSYTTNCVNNNIRIEGGSIALPKLGRVRIKQHRAIPPDYQLKSCTVSQSVSGKYYAFILFECEQVIKRVAIEEVVGLDFSMSGLYVSSESEYADYPCYYRRPSEKLKCMQIKLSKMTKYSNNYDRQKALNFGKSVSDNGWGMFVSFLQYKLTEQGKQLLKVDKWFPSSKTCSACGKKKETLMLSSLELSKEKPPPLYIL